MPKLTDTWTLTVRPERYDHRDPIAANRIKRLLKHLLRSWGLRCVSLSEPAAVADEIAAEAADNRTEVTL